jgi:acyl-CoA dehydrogenase
VDSAQASGYAGAGLTNQEYAPLAEIMGRVPWASEVFNCSAPDTGNMETIARYGDDANKARWLKPLLEGKIRSAFAMTEPEVASSDATNISTRIRARGRRVRHQRSQVVDFRRRRPALRGLHHHGQDRPGCAPALAAEHGAGASGRPASASCARSMCSATTTHRTAMWRCYFDNVRVPVSNILLGEGRGFEIAQGASARAASTTACA